MKIYVKSSELTQEDIKDSLQDPELVKELNRQGYIDFDRSRKWGISPRNSVIDSIERAASNSADPKLLRLILDKFGSVNSRRFIAKNPNTPVEILEELSEDTYGLDYGELTRVYVARNPNTPYDILVKLSQDDDDRCVRDNAEKSLEERGVEACSKVTSSLDIDEPYGFDSKSFDRYDEEDWAYYIANKEHYDEDMYHELLSDINNLRADEWIKDDCFEHLSKKALEAFKQFIKFHEDDEDVEACGDITASTKSHPSVPAGWEIIPEGDDEEGNWGTICKALPNDSGYVWIDMFYNEKDRRYYEIQYAYRKANGNVGEIWKVSENPFYSLNRALEYANRKFFSDSDDVEACGDITCSKDPELDEEFLIEGYYDDQKRGLAESAETSDVYALNELANEYANKGYYIRVHNITDGTVAEFSADSWFNSLAKDGGAELFMSW